MTCEIPHEIIRDILPGVETEINVFIFQDGNSFLFQDGTVWCTSGGFTG